MRRFIWRGGEAVARTLGVIAILLLPNLLVTGPATAQKLSDRPVTIIVPFTPGTGIDILARAWGEDLRQRWGQTVVIENRPGASGNIGTGQAARAVADGHTLLITVNTFVMNPGLFKSLPYDPEKSFAPIAELATGDVALVVHPLLNVGSVRGLIDKAKAEPTKINYASPGRGTPQHLGMELFKQSAGIQLTHVPYAGGSAGAVKDLVGGHVSAMLLPLHTSLPLVADKQLRMLAIGGAKRSPLAADVPTMAESGVTGFEVDLWYGLLAPAGTAPETLARYNTVTNDMLQTPAFRETLAKQGLKATGGTPEQLKALITRDLPRWAKVVQDARITAE